MTRWSRGSGAERVRDPSYPQALERCYTSYTTGHQRAQC